MVVQDNTFNPNTMGVHLEEPSSPLTQQWSADDLSDFVRQMTNPRKHRMSTDSSSGSVSPTTRKQNDSRKSSLDLPEQFSEKCSTKQRYASQSSRSSTDSHSRSLLSPDNEEQESEIFFYDDKSDDSGSQNDADDGICDVTETFTIKMSSNKEFRVTFTCDSSPEVSDTEPKSTADSKTKKTKESKISRFRKIIPRTLRRSHSAGGTKDVPSHALFLQYEKKESVESMESRRCKSTSYDLEEPRPRIVHKTSSADAAMMATEEFGAISSLQTQQARPKSRSIAKNVKRKFQLLKRRHTDSTLGNGIKQISSKNGTPTASEVAKWAESFDYLLSDKRGVEMFKDFLHSEFSEENLEFWLACEQFKSIKGNKLVSTAQKIYSEYVAAQSPKEINLDSKTRGTTIRNLSCPTRACFQDAQKRVQALMEKDSYPRFLESELYQRAVLRSQCS